MSDCARCINCGTDDVECTGSVSYEQDEYYCHVCEIYFPIDWDKQDEIEAECMEREGDEEAEEEDENEWENEGGSY